MGSPSVVRGRCGIADSYGRCGPRTRPASACRNLPSLHPLHGPNVNARVPLPIPLVDGEPHVTQAMQRAIVGEIPDGDTIGVRIANFLINALTDMPRVIREEDERRAGREHARPTNTPF